MPRFTRHLGVDYSGAGTADTPLTGLRLFEASGVGGNGAGTTPDGDRSPVALREHRPGPGRGHWTRRALASWLAATLRESTAPILVGIDHGLSFPEAYFAAHRVPRDWHRFLADFCRHWPTDEPEVTVEVLRRSRSQGAARRGGESRWRRLTEVRSGPAKSVFHFDVPGSVAKSTHAGLPWIRALGESVGWNRLHVWPFDGWNPSPDRHVIAEVYPARWSQLIPREPGHTPDQHDAASVAAALAAADRSGKLETLLAPSLTAAERRKADYEGWILGVGV